METWVILVFWSAKTLWVASNIQITQTGSSKNKQTGHQALVSTFRLMLWAPPWEDIAYPELSERLSSHGHKLEAKTPGLSFQLLILEKLREESDLVPKHHWLSLGHVTIPKTTTMAREMLWLARSESYVTPLHWGRVTYGSTRNDSWGGWQDSDQLSGRWNPGGSRVDDHHDLVECHEDAVRTCALNIEHSQQMWLSPAPTSVSALFS